MKVNIRYFAVCILAVCLMPVSMNAVNLKLADNPWIVPRVLKNGVIRKRVVKVREFNILLNQTQHLSRDGKRMFQWGDLRKMLMRYHLVPEYIWKHHYHHVKGMDIEGYLRLESRERVRWLVRPGGLVCVMWENGKVIYLVRRLSWKKDGATTLMVDGL